MTDPWASVAPAVVTSFITTLSTLGITSLVSRTRADARPIVVYAHRDSWVFENVSRRTLHRLNFHLDEPDGQQRLTQEVGRVERQSWYGLDAAEPGCSFNFAWTYFRLGRPKPFKNWWQGSVEIREGVDRYEVIRRRWPGPKR